MDHSMNTGSSSGSGMMIPYLHFTGGDFLIFSSWAPTSPGAIAGACFVLILIALVERLLAAMRSLLDLHWHKRALAIAAANDQAFAFQGRKETEPPPARTHSNVTSSATPSVEKSEEIEVQHRIPALPPTLTHRLPPIRTVPPFIAEHDVPRGILFALQMFLGYLLMLAVMTFQAAYLISIVLALGIGEMLFGRVARVH